MKKHLLVASVLTLSSATAQASECGSVQIAEMNWATAQLIANVDRFILEHAFDCDAELVPGDSVPTSTSMIEKQQPDIAPELWINSVKESLEQAVADGKLTAAGEVFNEGGQQGFWIPSYMLEKEPSLATIEGIKAHPEMFPHPEDPDKSGFFSCPAGWACQIIADNSYRALNLEASNFELVDPGSAAGLDGSLSRAHERGEGWFGYYWAPTAILGKYDMTLVDLGPNTDDEQHFMECITQLDCPNPKPTRLPASPVYTYTTAELSNRAPDIMEYLGNRSFTNQQLNTMLAWMVDNQADGDIAAEHFLNEYEDLWTAWLSDEQISKVKSAL